MLGLDLSSYTRYIIVNSALHSMVWYGDLLYTSRRKSHSTPRAGTRFASTRRHPRRVEGICHEREREKGEGGFYI